MKNYLMAPSAAPHVINIPETLRAIGAYAVVDDAILFVPSEVLDQLVEGDPSRVPGNDSYRHLRMCVYRACAMAPYLLAQSAGRERDRDLPERLVRFGSVRAALTHRTQLSRHYRRCGLPHGLPASSIFDEARAGTPINELAQVPPSAVGLVPPNALSVASGVTYDVAREEGTIVRVRPVEVMPGVGSYVWVDERGYFAPTRLVGELRRAPRAPNATLAEHVAATLAVFARLPRLYEEREARQSSLPFFRRIACFRSEDGAVIHRARLAAMFLLPASPTLTRPEEAPFHYGAADDCDRAWMASYLDASPGEIARPWDTRS